MHSALRGLRLMAPCATRSYLANERNVAASTQNDSFAPLTHPAG